MNKLTLFLFFTIFSNPTFANYNTILNYTTTSWGGINTTDKIAACTKAAQAHATQTARTFLNIQNCTADAVGSSTLQTNYQYLSAGNTLLHSGLVVATKIGVCVAPATPFYILGYPTEIPSPQCTGSCPSGTVAVPSTNTCAPIDCTDGKLLDSGTYFTTTTPLNVACVYGCSAIFVGTPPFLNCAFNAVVGTCDLIKKGRYVSAGTTCGGTNSGELTPTIATNPDSPENQCVKQGQSFGQVNGLTVCVPKGTTGSATVPPLPDAPKATTRTNPDGSKTTTTSQTVINNNGTVTTTTTITNTPASGGTGTSTTTTETQDQRGFCEENPTLNICKERSASGGTQCTSPPQCTGDDIDCITQKQIYEHRCHSEKLSEAFTETPEKSDYVAHKDNIPTDAQASDSLNSSGTLDIDVSQAFNTELSNNKFSFGSSGCPPPLTLTVLGKSYQLPLQVFCAYAVFVKFFVLFFAMMTALRIYISILFG